jgi:hypothetical protein
MDHYRNELEAARHRIAALEDQLQRREKADERHATVDALILREDATLAEASDVTRPLAMFKDEITQASERSRAYEMHRFARWGTLGSAIMGLLAMLPLPGGSLAAGLLVLGLICLPCGAFVVHSGRRLPRTHICPLCRKPGTYTDRRPATPCDVDRLLSADDASCVDLSAVPWFAELRKLFRHASSAKADERQQEIYRQMLAMSERMSVCIRHCYDCRARTKPFWTYTRPPVMDADARVN